MAFKKRIATKLRFEERVEKTPAEVAEELLKWAIAKMKYTPGGVHSGSKFPSKEDFESICTDEMKNAWLQVTQKVKPISEVKEFGKTFQNHRLKSNQQPCPKTPHQEYFAKLKDIKKIIAMRKQHIQKSQQQLVENDCEVQKLQASLGADEKKMALLKMKSQKIRQMLDKCNEYCLEYKKLLPPTKVKVPTPSVVQSSTQESKEKEEECLNFIDECYKKLKEFQNICKNTRELNTATIHSKKVELHNFVSENLGKFPAEVVWKTIGLKMKLDNKQMADLAAGVNLVRDAEELKFKCEADETFVSTSNPMGSFQSVEQIICQFSALHLNTSLEAHKHELKAASMKTKLETLRSNIVKELQVQVSSNNEVLDLAVQVVDTTLEGDTLKTYKAVLEDSVEELEHKSRESQDTEKKTREIYEIIKAFELTTEEKMSKIVHSKASNELSYNKLLTIQKEIKNVLAPVKSQTSLQQHKLRDVLMSEVRAFRGLPMELFKNDMFILDDSVQTKTPLIHCMIELHLCDNSSKEIVKLLDSAPNASSLVVILSLMEKVFRKSQFQRMIKEKKAVIEGGVCNCRDKDWLEEMVRALEESDKKCMKLVPKLKEMDMVLNSSMAFEMLQMSFREWVEQPAQAALTFSDRRVGGDTFEMWQKRTKIAFCWK